MVKTTRKIVICLVLGLTFSAMGTFANNLTQLDIKKSTSLDSTLNVTIYTSSPYDDNVAVSKKADNKYVIIMPNVSGVVGEKPDLSGLHDIISGIDVKSVQDGGNGYTKVTLTTTKPVSIRTATKKSAPLTAEQKAYKNLIAQSRKTKPALNKTTAHSTAAPTTTVKFSAHNQEHSAQKSAPKSDNVLASSSLKNSVKEVKDQLKPKSNKQVETTQGRLKYDTTSSVKDTVTTVKRDVNEDIEKHVPAAFRALAEAAASPEKTKTQEVSKTKEVTKNDNAIDNVEKSVNAISAKKVLSDKIDKRFSANVLTTILILLCSGFGLTLLFRLIKKSLEHSQILKQSFKENLLSKPAEVETYDDIVNDKDLNWQEKYQKFINNTKVQDTGKKILKHIGGGEYKFVNETNSIEEPTIAKNVKDTNNTDTQIGESDIFDIPETMGSAQLKPKKANKFKSYNKTAKDSSPDSIPPIKKVKNQDLKPQKAPKLQIVEDDYKALEESLERSLHQAPDKEAFDIKEEVILKQIQDNFKTVPVVSEDDVIPSAMHRSRKLKSFANKLALEETTRNAPEPKSRAEIRRHKVMESKHVELGNSPLYTNPRRLEGANLSVGDLIAKSDKFLDVPQHKDSSAKLSRDEKYSTVTLDEFFDKVDSSSKVTASASLASRVADSLGKMTFDSDVKDNKKVVADKKNPFDGVVILSGYELGNNNGFYVVRDNNGETSLIGRINNNVTHLKNFGRDTNIKLQVRLDSPNVYMVKANSNRYLVEVDGDKMGVLLEL